MDPKEYLFNALEETIICIDLYKDLLHKDDQDSFILQRIALIRALADQCLDHLN